MPDLIFVAQFTNAKLGTTGLTVTVDVDRYTISDGTRTALVTGGSATEGRRGLYHYRLASADLSLYQYVATFITASISVDQQEIPTLGLVVPDALVGSRLAPATAGRTLAVDASGNAAANVTYSAGVALGGRLAEVTDLPAAAPTAAAVADAVWDAARSGHAGAGTFGATDEWAGSVDEAAIADAVLAALEGSPITAICINPERSEESDYDNLRRKPADCC